MVHLHIKNYLAEIIFEIPYKKMKRKFGIVCGLSAIFCLLWVFFNNISNGSVINEGVLSDEEKLIINKEISCYFDHSRIDSIEPFNEKGIYGFL